MGSLGDPAIPNTGGVGRRPKDMLDTYDLIPSLWHTPVQVGHVPHLPQPYTYDFSSCFFPKFKKSAKGRFSREMTYFFDFYDPKIGGGGSSYPAFVQKYQKP